MVAHFYVGEGRGPLPNPHLLVIYVPLSFVLLDTLPLLVNSFHLFLITWISCTCSQNKHHCTRYMVWQNVKQMQTTNNGSRQTLLKTAKTTSTVKTVRVSSLYPTMLHLLLPTNGQWLHRSSRPMCLPLGFYHWVVCGNTIRVPTGSFLIPSGLDPHTEQCLFVGQLDEITCELPH